MLVCLAQQENVLLKRQIEASATEKGAQSATEGIKYLFVSVHNSSPPSHPSERAKASEEKFVKLREVYQKLRTEHIVLLRTNGESQKTLQTKEKEQSSMEGEVKVREGGRECWL